MKTRAVDDVRGAKRGRSKRGGERDMEIDREKRAHGELAYGNGARDSIITETRLIKDAQLKSSAVRSLGSFVRSFLVAQTSASPTSPK